MNKSSRAVAGQGPEAERRADGTGRSTQRGGDETVADFLRTVTHDLKGPLTAIRGQAQLLQRRASRQGRDADVKAAMAIVNQAQRMATILDGLLEAVLAQDGNLTLALAPLNLVALANAAVDTARDTAPDQPLTIHALEQDLLIEGDAARLARVFGSLLDSALRRSAPARQVQITLQRRGPEILVTIGDAGDDRGFTEVPEVAQAEPSSALDLSVYVSQRIVEAHGGRFWAGSLQSGGIPFTFTLPAGASHSSAPSVRPRGDPPRRSL
ncbi:MAG TPA: HAMP domain-containing sensor histidine kinase [Chloroflexota bacterium]|nr:HAMP domain-containing sensor histidine kinase [Chloroflexota bacterium]